MNYIVTIAPRKGAKERILTWATTAEQAVKQVSDFLLCPRSICKAEAQCR